MAAQRDVSSAVTEPGSVDYVSGANLAGFKHVADAMLAYEVV